MSSVSSDLDEMRPAPAAGRRWTTIRCGGANTARASAGSGREAAADGAATVGADHADAGAVRAQRAVAPAVAALGVGWRIGDLARALDCTVGLGGGLGLSLGG